MVEAPEPGLGTLYGFLKSFQAFLYLFSSCVGHIIPGLVVGDVGKLAPPYKLSG